MLLVAMMLVFGVSGQAMAYFAQGDLIQVVYQTDGANEVATDLGSLASLGGLTTAYSGPTQNLSGAYNIPLPGTAGAFSTANWANMQIAYYVSSGMAPVSAWTSGPQAGQVNGSRQGAAVAAWANVTDTYAAASATAQAQLLKSNQPSYYYKMDKGGQAIGSMAGFIQKPEYQGEQNLGALATPGSFVDSYLYYYPAVNTSTRGVMVATLRTAADGSTSIVGNPVPVPPSILLLGSGLMGLVGIRRKQLV